MHAMCGLMVNIPWGPMTIGGSPSILTFNLPAVAMEQIRVTPLLASKEKLCPERMTSTLNEISGHTWTSMPFAKYDFEKAMSKMTVS